MTAACPLNGAASKPASPAVPVAETRMLVWLHECSTTLDGQAVLRPLNAKQDCASADCFTKTQEARISSLARVTFADRNARTKILEVGNLFRAGRYTPAVSTCAKTVARVRCSRSIWRFNGFSWPLFCQRRASRGKRRVAGQRPRRRHPGGRSLHCARWPGGDRSARPCPIADRKHRERPAD